jgi:hypothetical protein
MPNAEVREEMRERREREILFVVQRVEATSGFMLQ